MSALPCKRICYRFGIGILFHLILLVTAMAKDHGANIFTLLNISVLLTDATKTMICYHCDRVDGRLVSKDYDSGEASEGRDGVMYCFCECVTTLTLIVVFSLPSHISWTAKDKRIARPNHIEWESTSGLKNMGSVSFLSQQSCNNSSSTSNEIIATKMTICFTFVAPRVVSSLFRRSGKLRKYTEEVLLGNMLSDFRDCLSKELSETRRDDSLSLQRPHNQNPK